jgi:serine/threonine protein kinase/Tfp pilus assembly protein PilF
MQMRPQEWQRIMDIFDRAVDLPPAERSALLHIECGDDAGLREYVLRLLDADQGSSSNSFSCSPRRKELIETVLRSDQVGAEGLSSRMIGTTVSHYRIEGELGRGGMGVVFQAYDTHLRRRVAIKILTEELATHGDAGSAVLAEARAASALNHPSIVTIYEVGEHNGEHFIVMELLSGTDLRSLMRAGSLELKTVFRIGAQVAEALYAAHSEGVIHGDVKPENVMVLSNGHVKLLDFGIARQFSVTTNSKRLRSENTCDPSRDPVFAATLAYTAPEALRSSRIDSRADLYSLGVLLFELATGSRPFDAPSPAVLIEQILHEPAPDMTSSADVLGERLGRVVKRLLAKGPDARYQSAYEIQVELAVAEREFEVGPIISSVQGNRRSLGVLPFRLLTPDPASEFLSVALADALINQLSSYREIIVRSTNSILRYANRIVDPLLAARELNTHFCVEGSIQKVGSRIRVHVQVWDTSSRRSLSSAKHDADDSELFQLQDSMADNVASVLGLALKPATGQPPPTNNPIAYELFLRAVASLSRYSRWEVHSAITLLEEAIRLDAQFADAWSQLADACMRMFTLFEPSEHWLRQAEHAVRRCLTVDPGNADGYCVHARIQWSPPRFKIRDALRSITKSLRLNPGCRQAQFWQGMYLFHVGLHEEANRAINAALAVNPEDPLAMMGIGHVAMYSWDFETAYKYHSRALAIDPSHFYAALFFPGVPLYTGDLNDAEDKINFARQIAPANPMVSSWEALLFAKRGDAERAEAALRSATRSKQLFTYSHHVAHTAAAALAILGKTDSAVTWLRRASQTGFPHYFVFRDDPHLTNLRDVPEYQKLLSALKRQWVAFHDEFGPRGKSDV